MGRGNTVTPVPPEDLGDWLDKLDWHFNSFCRNGADNPEDLIEDIRTRQRQLWIVGDVKAAVLTTVKEDNFLTCVVTHAAGRQMHDWVHLIGYLEDWARGIGCTRLQAITRPGYERFLDMKKTHVILEKRL